MDDSLDRDWTFGQDHLPMLASGQGAPVLRRFFQERTREWSSSLRHDECFTVGHFDGQAE